MKLLSARTVIPATAIAIGTPLVMGQPGAAADLHTYPLDDLVPFEDVNGKYSAYADQASSCQTYPTYHYAYYDIARPEYIL